MPAGRERNVLRWEARHALLSKQLAEVNAALAAVGEPKGPRERERLASLQRERDDLLQASQQLGPAPSPKMG
jgi:hypothetical protein